MAKYKSNGLPLIKIDNEIKSLEPYINKISLGESFYKNDSNQVDTLYTLLITYDRKIRSNKKKKSAISKKLGDWLKVRLEKDTVLVVDVN